MVSYEGKLVPELVRWMEKNAKGQRTVIVRLAYSQNADEAANMLRQEGMVVESCGTGTVIGAGDCQALRKIAELSGVIKIDVPQRLDMKASLDKV